MSKKNTLFKKWNKWLFDKQLSYNQFFLVSLGSIIVFIILVLLFFVYEYTKLGLSEPEALSTIYWNVRGAFSIPQPSPTPVHIEALTNNPTPTLIPLPPLSHTTYTSVNLGISFTYASYIPVTSTTGMRFYIKEINNTVYLYDNPASNQPFSGTETEFLKTVGFKFIQVFNKDPNQSLVDAIKQQFLAGYSQDDCIININRYGHPREDESFQTASLTVPVLPTYNRTQLDALSAKCPKYSTPIYGVSYFIVDPKHPDKLLFVYDGQDDIPAGVNGSMWDGTIKVLQ